MREMTTAELSMLARAVSALLQDENAANKADTD